MHNVPEWSHTLSCIKGLRIFRYFLNSQIFNLTPKRLKRMYFPENFTIIFKMTLSQKFCEPLLLPGGLRQPVEHNYYNYFYKQTIQYSKKQLFRKLKACLSIYIETHFFSKGLSLPLHDHCIQQIDIFFCEFPEWFSCLVIGTVP